MGKFKIIVYAISKNEEKFVDRWVESMKEADKIIVFDTGSTDNTVEKLKSLGVIVHTGIVKPWRFDVARNQSLSYVDEDTDVCVCTDLDEVFVKGWRKHIEDNWNKNLTMINYLYNWSIKEDGTPGVQFHYFKIHSRNDYKWSCPIHEYLEFIGKGRENKKFVKEIVLNHYPDNTKSRSSYLDLLKTAVLEDEENDRMNYYLGREYMYIRDHENCISTLTKYLKLKRATWIEERCAAMRWIAKSYAELHNTKEAYKWYYRAIAECPSLRDPFIEAARFASNNNDFITSYYMVKEALKIQEKSAIYVNTESAWDHTPYDLLSISAFRLGLIEESFINSEIAYEMNKTDERLKKNYEIVKEIYNKNIK